MLYVIYRLMINGIHVRVTIWTRDTPLKRAIYIQATKSQIIRKRGLCVSPEPPFLKCTMLSNISINGVLMTLR